MHHFIYPSQDTFLSNQSDYQNKNFGLDEILSITSKASTIPITIPTRSLSYTEQTASNFCVGNFSGVLISASFTGTASYITGSASGGTGSISGSSFSGSTIFDDTLFSGSVTDFSGSVTNFGGEISYAIITGNQIISQSHTVISNKKLINRSLVKFDITTISQSIADGDIASPTFTLKLNVAKEENLPLDYSIYAFAISQSWTKGIGYLSDNGTNTGTSWNFRDYYSGSVWYPLSNTDDTTIVDFVTNPQSASAIWNRGGGTWYTSSICSQSFDYESADLSMDVSSIVYQWISGSIPNEGFIIITDEEFELTGSNTSLSYFSQDSNTIYQPRLDVAWDDTVWVTGSINTGSVTISTSGAGILGTILTGSTISGSSVNGGFNGTVNLNTTSSGAINAYGFSGSINNMHLFGNISYSLSASYDISSSVTSSYILGAFEDSYFSGSVFTASINLFTLTGGSITGSWNDSHIIGNTISASYPFPIDPSLFVKITGRYVTGTALGTYQQDSFTSGSFTGVLTDGPAIGAVIYIPFTGSFLTASYSETSSVVIESSSLEAVQFQTPFVAVVQNIPSTIKSGNIIRINVFARPEYPLKNFQRRTQFTQFLTPQYLPTSSYYAIKDNETEQNFVDFDNYTKLSCDETGNYFFLDTTGLPQERYFKILIKSEQSGSSYVFDKGNIFKITR